MPLDSTLAIPFPQYAAEVRREVGEALDRLTQFGPDCPAHLREAIRHSLLAPGKRLRPMLVLMASEACGYERQRAMPAACAVEMVHTYSLVHDDLPAMDDDDVRRGRPSCHAAFGEATAILAGDALLATAFEVLARDVSPAETAARCCAELGRAAGATALVGGQADDLAAENRSLGIQELEHIHRRKTGALFRVSLRLGGIVSGASEEELAALDDYGTKLGLAFQIVDDLLDLQGDAAAMGKRTGKDGSRGKLTFPGMLGVEESSRRAEQLIDDACLAVAGFGSRGQQLVALARYILKRTE
jgi:geranylgeranyl diphosphate synthase type II